MAGFRKFYMFLRHLLSCRGYGRKTTPISSLCILEELFCGEGNIHDRRIYSQRVFLLRVTRVSVLKYIQRDRNVLHCICICIQHMEHSSVSEKRKTTKKKPHCKSSSAMEADASLQLYVFILTRWRSPCPPHLRVIFLGFAAQEL